ncbi:hypothetical protein FJTKL_12312 [Diaporthe vaccinii]|uniref:Uncharacterized protein n=1 Tax=Diaporthe vaccinii TaxID=105482 RepID=A0ABR4EEC7_9PEZI
MYSVLGTGVTEQLVLVREWGYLLHLCHTPVAAWENRTESRKVPYPKNQSRGRVVAKVNLDQETEQHDLHIPIPVTKKYPVIPFVSRRARVVTLSLKNNFCVPPGKESVRRRLVDSCRPCCCLPVFRPFPRGGNEAKYEITSLGIIEKTRKMTAAP